MAHSVEAHQAVNWLNQITQLANEQALAHGQKRIDVLVDSLRQRLLYLEIPPDLNNLEGLDQLKNALQEKNQEAAKRLEGLVDDLAACIQGKKGAELAVAIRLGDMENIKKSFLFPKDKQARRRIYRAILEAYSAELLQALPKDRPKIPSKDLAEIINRGQIPMTTVSKVMGEKADKTLRRLAPYLTYANLWGLDSSLQESLLKKCIEDRLVHLRIHSNTILTLPSGMTSLKSLDCSGCYELEKLPDGMRALRELHCRECENLEELPGDMENLESLHCGECYSLKKLPDGMKTLRYLDCSWCCLLQNLPDGMGALETLDCHRCEKLSRIPDGMDALCQLNCSYCTKLTSLPEGMSTLESLSCVWNNRIERLPNGMTALQRLICNGCQNLTTLPDDIEALQVLSCAYCAGIETLPNNMATLHKLNCTQCISLQALPDGMTNLRKLNCEKCNNLLTLPDDMAALQRLDCRECAILSHLPPSLPNCSYLNFSLCPLLLDTPTPEVPATAEIYRAVPHNENHAARHHTWSVPYEAVHEDPESFLCQLGTRWLLEGLPFPNVAYQEKGGQAFKGIDFGGVRRDLVSRILTYLFQEDLGEGKALNKRQSGLPTWNCHDESQELAYRSLARLMSLAYLRVCNLTTGPLFPKSFYEALLTETGSLHRIAALQEIDPELVRLATSQEPFSPVDLTKANKETIRTYLDPKLDRFEGETWDEQAHAATVYFQEHREELKMAIMADGDLLVRVSQVVDCVREELQRALGLANWKQIQEKGPDYLQKAIEGELSAEALCRHIDWDFGLSTDKEITTTQNYLEEWIHHAKDQEHQIFVRALSGNRSLTPKRLKIKLFRRGSQIPIAHSCSYSLELSSQLPDQQTFNQMIKLFLEYAMAESGFQMA